jgi:hypothetical protein
MDYQPGEQVWVRVAGRGLWREAKFVRAEPGPASRKTGRGRRVARPGPWEAVVKLADDGECNMDLSWIRRDKPDGD